MPKLKMRVIQWIERGKGGENSPWDWGFAGYAAGFFQGQGKSPDQTIKEEN